MEKRLESDTAAMPQTSMRALPFTHLHVLNEICNIAEREPKRPALRADRRSIDFGELVAASARVRDRLLDAGIGPEDVVATILPRGGNAVIAMFGIWMSGAAYLPTDIRWPEQRLELVLAESATCVLEAAVESAAEIVGIPGETGLRLRNAEPGRARSRATGSNGRNLAYVLYTSGSTGAPNAVGVEYAALDNYGSYLRELVERVADPAGGALTVLLSADLCFDASLRPLLLLAAGATLVVSPESTEGAWQEQITEDGVTVLSGVPSWYSGLLSAGFVPRDSSVRLAFVGGEAVPNGLVRELAAAGCAVVVQYGPTETTVAATGGLLTGEHLAEPPLGDAIPGARIQLYQGDNMAAAAEDEPGYLYVSGAGLARGYLHNPRLTAERFVPDPSGPPGSRMFRTGDLGRTLPHGGYSFLGRRDDQVKIGGRRIELGEVTAVLNRHPAVIQSVVVVHNDGTHPRLAAFYVATTGAVEREIDERIRDHLVGTLPGYLVPALIRRVAALPVTDHGKVDTAALVQSLSAGDAEAPADESSLDEVERRLIAILHKTLGVPCTLDDNLVALGGSSLDAIEILRRIREEFGVRLRLRDLFRADNMRVLRDLIGDVN